MLFSAVFATSRGLEMLLTGRKHALHMMEMIQSIYVLNLLSFLIWSPELTLTSGHKADLHLFTV